MRFGVRSILGIAVSTTVLATACSDSLRAPATAPVSPTETSAQLLGGLLGTVNSLLVTPVHRRTALANDVTWSFYAGPLGGRSSNSAVGLSVYVPSGALDKTVRITVTALKGTVVAYRFEPHLEFERKVVLTQDLDGLRYGLLGTNLLGSFKGAHFEGDEPEITNGQALVTEVVDAVLNLFSKKVSFGVDHFSGWILASGYDDQ